MPFPKKNSRFSPRQTEPGNPDRRKPQGRRPRRALLRCARYAEQSQINRGRKRYLLPRPPSPGGGYRFTKSNLKARSVDSRYKISAASSYQTSPGGQSPDRPRPGLAGLDRSRISPAFRLLQRPANDILKDGRSAEQETSAPRIRQRNNASRCLTAGSVCDPFPFRPGKHPERPAQVMGTQRFAVLAAAIRQADARRKSALNSAQGSQQLQETSRG